MERIICVAIGYLFGLLQTGYLYGKTQHVDIRKEGSGECRNYQCIADDGMEGRSNYISGGLL